MKSIKYLAAAAMAMLAIGCAKEQTNGSEIPDGQEINVTFNASLPGGINTRAIGDGTTANQLIVAVYDNTTGKELQALRKDQPISISTTVEFNLVKGKTYSFVFWAQVKDNTYYNTSDLRNIIIDYTGKDANDETRDAFFATRMNMKVTGAMSETVTLRRPFSQVNFGTSDFAEATAAGFVPTLSSFTATEAATVFDPVNEEGKNRLAITLNAKELPTEDLKVKINNVENSYKWMTMNYFLPVGKLDEKHVSDVTATFTTADNQTVTISAPNAPVQGNYRTNILGRLLTDQTIFNVVIDPAFNEVDSNDPDYSDSPDYIYNQLSLAFANGGVVDLTKDVVLDETLTVPAGKSVVLNLNGKTITNNGKGSTVKVEGNLTIGGNGTIDGGKGGDNNAVQVNAGGEVVIENGTFKVGPDASGMGNSCIYANGGSVIIYDGYFSTEAAYRNFYYVLNQNNGKPGTIKVYGGQFENYDPKVGDDNLGGNFIADGYKSTKISDSPEVYVVTKADVTPVGNQEGLNDAITNASKGQSATVTLPSGSTFTLDNDIANEGNKSRDITFVGDGTQTFDVVTKAVGAEGGKLNYQRGSSFTFKNMTIQAGEGNFDGIVCDELTYENCTIKGKLTLYGKATFVNCTFENDMANQYSIWTWGGTDVKFDGCEFNTNGKAILLYGQATAEKPTNLTVSNCIFNDRNNGSAGKAAIEIGNDYNATYTLNISGCTVNGFADGKNTGSKIWANKNSMDAAHLSVTIDGTKVL